MGASLGRIDSSLFKSRSIGRRWEHNGKGVQFLHSNINGKKTFKLFFSKTILPVKVESCVEASSGYEGSNYYRGGGGSSRFNIYEADYEKNIIGFIKD